MGGLRGASRAGLLLLLLLLLLVVVRVGGGGGGHLGSGGRHARGEHACRVKGVLRILQGADGCGGVHACMCVRCVRVSACVHV